MDEEQAIRSGLGQLVAKALHLVRKLREIGIDREEYALLKAIILCNVGEYFSTVEHQKDVYPVLTEQPKDVNAVKSR